MSTYHGPCIYYNKNISILWLFVYDVMIAGRNEEVYTVLDKMSQEFNISVSKSVQNQILYRNKELNIKPGGTAWVNPGTEKILKRMNLDQCNLAPTPIEQGHEEGATWMINLFQQAPLIVKPMSLLYLATITKPEISLVMNYLSCYCS